MDKNSLWKKISHSGIKYPLLNETIEVDVLIIGGGITGITAATQLLASGKKIAIVEAHTIGGVTTSLSTGNLYVPVQPFYQTIASKFDIATAAQVAKSRQFAIDYIENTIADYKIDCNFTRRPWFAYTEGEKETFLEKELTIMKQLGIEVDYVSDLPYKLNFTKAISIQNQARFNPLQYLISLAEELNKKGCLIYENTPVEDIQETENICSIKTAKGEIKAQSVFMATHTPLGIDLTQQFTAPYRSYVVALQLDSKQYEEGHLINMDSSSYSISTHADKTNKPGIILIAGSHHKTGQDGNMKEHYSEIEKFLKKHFSQSTVSLKWSAQHYQSADSLPYIGLQSKGSKRLYIATGYFADGLVYGTLAGLIVADLIEKKNPFTNKLYSSTRSTPLASMNFFLKENANVLAQYIKDLPQVEQRNFKAIKPGEGKVVVINQEKCAVSRDVNNNLHMLCAVCPHMKCIVNWNNAEQTWDCPCHGSRFTQTGQVIEGPATANLDKFNFKEESV
ncbi:MAG: FAD-dependent oxidoreductase [Tatlockia sp.]|nr:FAD-dependent oxidoreductase [Tatlockia sp.]